MYFLEDSTQKLQSRRDQDCILAVALGYIRVTQVVLVLKIGRIDGDQLRVSTVDQGWSQ